VVARHEANALAEREGLAGIRRVLSQLVDRVAEPSARADGGPADRAPLPADRAPVPANRAPVPAPEPDRGAAPEPTEGRS
jgi:hypothetical protein